MEKKKYPHTDPNTQVHSEFETTVGNSFNVVRRETPTNNKNEADKDDPLNQLPEDEYAVINEWDMEAKPPGIRVDRVVGLIGLLSLIGLIGVIRVVKS